ncbi:MAG: HEAT repeat domain-containing protein [Candidatus Methylomirabilales bacterium]
MVKGESKDLHADTGLNRELAEILVGIRKAIKTFLFYRGDHPARGRALLDTHKQLTELIARQGSLSLRVSPEGFSHADAPVGQNHPRLQGFPLHVFVRGIQAIRFLPGARLEDLQHLTDLLILKVEDLSQQGGAQPFLQQRGVSTIEVEAIDIQFTEMEPVTPEETFEEELEPVTQIKEEEESPPELEALIAELQKTTRPARYEQITEELSQWARDALLRGEVNVYLRIMTALGLELHASNSKDQTITRYAHSALNSLLGETGPQPLIEGFCRGGVLEDDLVHLLLTLKEQMAGPVVDQILFEDDVASRRKLMDLLTRMGTTALPPVRSVLKAPSWDMARRLIPLLTRLPEGAEILKTLMRHSDARIRRESIRLYGQMGAKVTGEPLLKALEDPETPVRQAAISVLGGLKTKAAVSSLRQIAEDYPGNREPEEQKIAIAALGAIGDPEALPTLITLLRRRRWILRRTTEELRVAAAYALGALGGPEAVKALQSVGHSAPPALRQACETVLKGLKSETEGA